VEGMKENHELAAKIFEEDGKRTAIMMLDFFVKNRIPHDVAILSSAIACVSLCVGNGMSKKDFMEMIDELYRSYMETERNDK